jgi:hypothetical protein
VAAGCPLNGISGSAVRPHAQQLDGNLVPTKKDQALPDLKYFKQPQK